MKHYSLIAFAFLFTCILFVSCNDKEKTVPTAETTQPAFDLTAARKEIDTANRNFMDLVAKGDSIGLANMYTVDAKMMGPNGPAVSGRNSIQSALSGMVQSGIVLNLQTNEVWGNENMLAEEGALTVSSKDGKQLDKGKYLVLWKKDDGKWKLLRDMFNSDLPGPGK